MKFWHEHVVWLYILSVKATGVQIKQVTKLPEVGVYACKASFIDSWIKGFFIYIHEIYILFISLDPQTKTFKSVHKHRRCFKSNFSI